jgi:dipeptidyl aminopeptidase/acylaminoacyl peptidase
LIAVVPASGGAPAVLTSSFDENPSIFELYQGLQDYKVPTRLIVYQGFGGIGHGPSKPKSNRATMEHNLEWFDEHFFKAAPRPSSAQK